MALLLHEQLGVLTHSNLLRSTGLPLAAIDAEHFQVRRISQLTTTELAETKDDAVYPAAEEAAVRIVEEPPGAVDRDTDSYTGEKI